MVAAFVEVPKTLHGYDLAGSQIWFHMQVGANGPVPTILYYNGSRIALGDDLEKQLLFNEAKPGEKVLIAVKLLQTQDDKYIHAADLNVVFSSNRPNPANLRDELISAAHLLPADHARCRDLGVAGKNARRGSHCGGFGSAR